LGQTYVHVCPKGPTAGAGYAEALSRRYTSKKPTLVSGPGTGLAGPVPFTSPDH